MRKIDDIDLSFLWRIFRLKCLFLIATAIFFFVITFVYYSRIVKPVYQVRFSLFAWDTSSTLSSDTVNMDVSSNQAQSLRSVQMIDRDLAIADKMLNDYRELMKSDYVNTKVREGLEEYYPELFVEVKNQKKDLLLLQDENEVKKRLVCPFSHNIVLSHKTHFIECWFMSENPSVALAAADVSCNVFLQATEERLGMSKIMVIDTPRLLPHPVNRRAMLKALIAGFISASLLYLCFLIREMILDQITSTEQFEKELKVPLLGSIVKMKRHKEFRNEVKIFARLNNFIAPEKEGGEEKPYAYNFNHFYEDFQILLTNLQYASVPKENRAQIFMVTSSAPNDGKTLISAYLSLFLAEKDKKVLLIHTDIRKGASTDYFGFEKMSGLTDYIIQKKDLKEKTLDEIIHRNIYGTKLDIIPAGPVPPNPLRLIEIFANSGFIEEQAVKYDYIIIDTPPASILADALVLGKHVDDIILVINARKTAFGKLKTLTKRLKELNLPISGVILNQFSTNSNSYDYGYGYGTEKQNKHKRNNYKKK